MASRKTALVVDDSMSTRMIVSSLLESICPEWEIVQACDGNDALSKVEGVELDTMLIDINMPGIDGFELAELLHKQFPAAHIAMLTANIQSRVQARAADCGYQFIPKPVTEEKLTEFVALAEGE